MKKKGRRRRKEGEEEDEKGDKPPLDVFARFATGFELHTAPRLRMLAHLLLDCIIKVRAQKQSTKATAH